MAHSRREKICKYLCTQHTASRFIKQTLTDLKGETGQQHDSSDGTVTPTDISAGIIQTDISEDTRGFPGGSVGENSPTNAGDVGSTPGPDDPTRHRARELAHHNH